MLNEWPRNMRDAECNTYSVAPLPHLPRLSLSLTIQPGLALILWKGEKYMPQSWQVAEKQTDGKEADGR